MQKLRHLGIEDLGLPLPKIVVVGDQSTGKSSLIEGMSEIKVPRSTGTCTRCPMEINLTQDSSHKWRCKVTIHKKFMYMGQLGTSRAGGKNMARIEGATKSRPLGPWTPQESDDYEFATITSASEVPNVLYLAQLAVLNPSHNYEDYAYVPGKARSAQEPQVKFSPNVVRLDISGRDLPNLSFFDLPGIINVADLSEDAYLVDLVKNLVKEYVMTEDCINLLAITMTDDPANSSASKLLRDLKVDKKTVGCLTKPDRLMDDESLAQWIQILRGESFQLGHGYYVIKNNKDPHVDHATARREEADFFDQDEPWTGILRPYHKQFGTLQLQAALSDLLTMQIQKRYQFDLLYFDDKVSLIVNSLPRISEQVKNKAAFIDTELMALPEVIQGNLPAVVMDELGKFSVELQKHIDGGSQMCPFQKQFHELAIRFRHALANTKPKAVLREATTSSRTIPTRETPNGSVTSTPTPGPRGPPITIDIDSDDDSHAVRTPVVHRSGNKRPFYTPNDSPNKMPRTESTFTQSSTKSTQSKYFTLPEVRQIIQRGYISLPGQIDPKAIEELIRLSMLHWGELADNFLAQTKKLCQNTILEQVREVFGHRQHTAYFAEILTICDNFLEESLAEQVQVAKRVLKWELAKPKTLNERAMSEARDEAQALLLSERRKVLAEPFLEEQEEKNTKQSNATSRDEKLAKVPNDKLVPEAFGPELKAMAVSIGYSCHLQRLTMLDRKQRHTTKWPIAVSSTTCALVSIASFLSNVVRSLFRA